MQLISVNIGQERSLQMGSKVETTGIYKIPVNESVEIGSLGIQSDFIASKKHHGGPDQAVYVYGAADYEWWSQELEHEISPGAFGENLTISGLQSAQFNIGDRLHVGTTVLEVTAPRIPCGTFAARMGDPQFVKRFRGAERPGLYCRVIKEGVLRAGDDVRVERRQTGEFISIRETFRYYYSNEKNPELIRKYLNAPIAIRWREKLKAELDKLSTGMAK
jgi:MOSC domain-containing protein YiiM